jgi:Kdo2-lipid IVA lauroyltransferase/acyltransferase
MASASSTASPRVEHAASASAAEMLRQKAASGPIDNTPREEDFPPSRGVKSTRLKLGFKDSIIFWLMVAALHALSLLPDFVLYRLGIIGALMVHRFDHRHTKIGLRNLEIAFPEKSDAERRRILRASYINLGRAGAEYIRLGGFFYRRLARRITYNRVDLWQKVRAKVPGKGLLVLTAHFGGFELLPAGHALHGFQITLVHHTQRFKAGDSLMTFVRERAGVQIIRKHSAAREILRSLRRGEIVGIPLDQNAKRSEAVWVPFFGELAATPGGFDRLSMMAGSPVLPVFIVRQPDGRSHVIEMFEEIPQQRTGDRDADAMVNTARYQKAIEEMVRRYPEQWLWTHRRYRTRPVSGSPSLYD